ncbi:DUF86 domain-containing protein [soil metagenome]
MSKAKDLRVTDYLEHILEAIQRIYQYTENMTNIMFFNNTLVQDAVIRNFENIGEACRNIQRQDPFFCEKHPYLPLDIAYEMRNALAHGYFDVDMEIVWDTIEQNLPNLKCQVQKILAETRYSQ